MSVLLYAKRCFFPLIFCSNNTFLGPFEKNCGKRQLASSCLSVRMEQLGSHLTDFYEIWYLRIFRKFKKIQISLKSGKINEYFTPRRVSIYDSISLNFFYNEKCYRQT
jgi:hypothetical protein